MEFPNNIKEYILSYLSHPYKKPPHVDVIKRSRQYRIHTYKKPPHLDVFKRSELLIDFRFNRLFFLQIEDDIENSIHSIWIDSVTEFQIFRNMIRMGELVIRPRQPPLFPNGVSPLTPPRFDKRGDPVSLNLYKN